MLHSDPNTFPLNILFFFSGIAFSIMNFLSENADMSMKFVLFILGVISYCISIYQSLKKKNDKDNS